MGWWEKSSDDYLYHSDWNTHIREVFTKIEDQRKLYFGKVDNDFAQYFGGILAFPSSATVYEANEHGVIELKPFAKVQGKDGKLALYSPIPSYDSTFGVCGEGYQYFEDAYRLQAGKITTQGNYTSVTGEVIATGDGFTTEFTYTTAHGGLKPKTVKITYTIGGTTYNVTDDGYGNISDDNVSGTVNYDTGEINLTFTTAPDDGSNITVDYDYLAYGQRWLILVSFEILCGRYKLLCRIKDTNNVADDVKITVTNVNDGTVLYEGTFTLSGSDWQLIETDVVDLTDLSNKYVEVRIEKATIDENTIYVDYVTLDPYGWTPEIYYVVPDEDRHIGEVKVWDTMGSDDESQWVRVFNKEHKFVGDCVVENGLLRINVEIGKIPTIQIWDGSINDWSTYQHPFMDDNGSTEGFRIEIISNDLCKVYVKQTTDVEYTLNIFRHGVTIDSIYMPVKDYNIRMPLANTNVAYVPFSQIGHVGLKELSTSGSYIIGLCVDRSYLYEWINDTNAMLRLLSSSRDLESYQPKIMYAKYEQWINNLFKEAEDATLSTAPDPLTYTDDFSEDTSARYMLDSDKFTWDTTNGIVTTTTAPAKTVLRSLKFAHGDYNLKVKVSGNGEAGLLLMWQPTEDSGYIVRIDEANDVVELVRVDNGTETVLASGSVTIDADTWYSLHVNVDDAGNFTVDVDGTTVISGVSDAAYSSGYVGLYNGAGSSSFDDLDVTAHEIVGRGAQVNRFIDDFDWDSSAEYSGDVDSFTWDTTNGIIKTTANNVQVTLNALKFGNGSYKVRIIPKDISGDLYIHILFVRQEQGNGNANANGSGYVTILDCNNNEVKITRVDNGSSTSLGSASYTFNAGEWYDVEVQWDTSTGDITVSINGTQIISVTDTTYNGGYAGIGMGGNSAGDEVWFDDLEINAEEMTSSGNSCVILGGVNHGGRFAFMYNEQVTIPNVEPLVPKGRYLAVVRCKPTSTTASALVEVKNGSDGVWVYLDGGKLRPISWTGVDYDYYVFPIAIDDNDANDTIWWLVRKVGDVTPAIAVDYFLLIPISGLESQTLMPQDIAVRSMVHTEYVDDAVDKAFDVREEFLEPKKPMREVTAYIVDAQSAKVNKIQIGYVSGDYGADWSGFDTSVLSDYADDGSMVLVVNTNASASPKMKLYAYHSDVGWNEV